jgi:uncharacterized membrane protein
MKKLLFKTNRQKSEKKAMTLQSNKMLGGIGSILLLLGVIPYAQPIPAGIALIGLILVLIALYGLANFYKDNGIFDNALYGSIAAIVGGVATVAAAFYMIFDTSIFTDFLHKLYPGWDGTWSSLANMKPTLTNLTVNDWTSILGPVFAVLVILWVFLIISAYFNRQSLNRLSAKANVGLFSTAGLILIIGATLAIILIGLVLMWVAVLLMAIAFFQIPVQPEQPMAPPAPPPQTPGPA